jgi:hypothetical protein
MTATPIVWTRQHPFLWTGRRGGMPVGTIERGIRYTFIDAEGMEHHGFRTLEAAQDAAAELLPEPAGR